MVDPEMDIYKRNREAFRNVLWAARDERLMEIARSQAAQTAQDRVIAFVDETIERVQEVVSSSQQN